MKTYNSNLFDYILCHGITKKIMECGCQDISSEKWDLAERINDPNNCAIVSIIDWDSIDNLIDDQGIALIPRVIQNFRQDCKDVGIEFDTWKEVFEAYQESK